MRERPDACYLVQCCEQTTRKYVALAISLLLIACKPSILYLTPNLPPAHWIPKRARLCMEMIPQTRHRVVLVKTPSGSKPLVAEIAIFVYR